MLRSEKRSYQPTATNPWICRGPELLTPGAPAHTATGDRTEWAVYDDADPLTWWPLCERCAKGLGHIW